MMPPTKPPTTPEVSNNCHIDSAVSEPTRGILEDVAVKLGLGVEVGEFCARTVLLVAMALSRAVAAVIQNVAAVSLFFTRQL